MQEILSKIAATIIAVEYWYDVSNELLLETSMKVAHEAGLLASVWLTFAVESPARVIELYVSLATSVPSKPTVLYHLRACGCAAHRI